MARRRPQKQDSHQTERSPLPRELDVSSSVGGHNIPATIPQVATKWKGKGKEKEHREDEGGNPVEMKGNGKEKKLQKEGETRLSLKKLSERDKGRRNDKKGSNEGHEKDDRERNKVSYHGSLDEKLIPSDSAGSPIPEKASKNGCHGRCSRYSMR